MTDGNMLHVACGDVERPAYVVTLQQWVPVVYVVRIPAGTDPDRVADAALASVKQGNCRAVRTWSQALPTRVLEVIEPGAPRKPLIAAE